MPASSKQQAVYATPQGYNGQKPTNLITHRSQTKLRKVPVMGKNHLSLGMEGKRIVKPLRVQNAAYSQKDEVLALAPSTSLVSKLPIPQYTLPKIQAQNDVHYTFQAQNDEYSRNLVPPPPSKQYIEKEKPKEKPIVFKQKEQTKPVIDSTQDNKQRPVASDTALFQVPPPYHQTTYYIPASNEQTVDVQVTKENIKEFHNNIPYQQQQQQRPDLIYNSQFTNYQFTKKPTETPMIPTYEVTEEKDWREIPPSYQQQFLQEVKHFDKIKPSMVKQQNEDIESFLPTPVKPSGVVPTSPTQADISTIFTELSQKINRQKDILNPAFFNIKEVSTHYPILGKPSTAQFSVQYSLPVQDNADDSNEITTIKPRERFKIKEIDISTEIQTTATPIPIPTRDWQQKRRPGHRRRRPINRTKFTSEEPSTTTEDILKEIEQTTVKERRRRPVQIQRTTEAPAFIENVTKRIRYRQRIRPTAESTDEEMPHNHKISFTEDVSQPVRGSYNYKTSIDNVRKRPLKQHNTKTNEDIGEEYSTLARHKPLETITNKETEPNKYYSDAQNQQNTYQSDTSSEEISEEMYESDKLTTSEEPTTIITTVASEFITKPINKNIPDDSISIKEIYTDVPESSEEETTLATTTASTTTPTTTTAAEPKTTTKSNRFRRPIHYKPPRPKFSVKDYHQRLNQYISSTETSKLSTEPTRIRYRTRRPLIKQEEHETTETARKRFIPKSHRQPTASESKDEPVETSVRTVNSRIRPFGKHRSTTTTEATTTQKISIKPHIFNTLRRPPPISLKERIQSKYNRSNTTEKNVKSQENVEENETEIATTEMLETTHNTEIPATSKIITTTTSTITESEPEIEDEEDDDVKDMEIFKNDALLHSQRVSDLTSSTQNQYDTPGMFKSVSPNARKVPNYFALATEDPILPIEAFFPNINKEKFS
ncbi:hypothetical protein MML48_2g00007899 [Holotrichia oblita]|uniref:Uncharacterized protein n=1 Tax=Holotrichia oblita TaxID=644536 RepID=A0ACB9TNF3_HOLOL|nr:hypothetical protein MML48_2g00007899 [Holotrichia oblita]